MTSLHELNLSGVVLALSLASCNLGREVDGGLRSLRQKHKLSKVGFARDLERKLSGSSSRSAFYLHLIFDSCYAEGDYRHLA